jgi:hypothetical protein
MKKFNSIIVKALFAVVLLTSATVYVNTSGINTVSEAKAATYQDVYSYLTCRGYEVITLGPASGTKCNWLAQTIKDGRSYLTTVYCNCMSGEIVGQNDLPM